MTDIFSDLPVTEVFGEREMFGAFRKEFPFIESHKAFGGTADNNRFGFLVISKDFIAKAPKTALNLSGEPCKNAFKFHIKSESEVLIFHDNAGVVDLLAVTDGNIKLQGVFSEERHVKESFGCVYFGYTDIGFVLIDKCID